MYALIVTEKPDAAARIATALDVNGKPKKIVHNGVPIYEAKRKKHYIVVPSLGHLYTVTSKNRSNGEYPVFDVKWVPRHLAERGLKRIRSWLETITKLAENADEFIDACDYDIEGSIIGYTILKYACEGKHEEAKRMKYSTLTPEEIQESYANMSPTLDFSLIEAGLARHEIDWLYGVNLSRALTQAAKKHSGRYTTLSTGRVQGPTLKFLATRELSIRNFVPIPYWTVSATFGLDHSVFEAAYEKNPIDTKAEANAIVKTCMGKKGTVRTVESQKILINPPPPFDLGSLQNEAYRLFKYTPMFTLKVAQRLYLDALISYPRTSCQRLPISIGYKTILQKLAKSDEHGRFARALLAKPELKPKEGKGFDPAHPAIYPTGTRPDRMLNTAERRIWNLVVRRFMAVFAESSIQQTIKATIAVHINEFTLTGRQTIEEGWMHFYKPFVHSNDFVFPRLVKGQEIDIENVAAQGEFTKPPPRYNPSSLLKKMQKEKLGTKATRAGIIQTLYDRKYITQEKIVVTEVGFEVVRVLHQYCPDVLSSKLTAKLEDAMSEIQEKNETRQILLERAIEILQTITSRLKEQEPAIGKQLSRALKESRLEELTVGTCPICKTGKLVVLHSKKTGKRFVGCTNYFKNTCANAFPLPQSGVVKPLHNVCASCGSPTVQIYQKGKHSWKLCINPVCGKKQPGGKAK